MYESLWPINYDLFTHGLGYYHGTCMLDPKARKQKLNTNKTSVNLNNFIIVPNSYGP